MDFDTWLDAAWTRHADDAAGVAASMAGDGLALATTEAALDQLARLAHHVHGDHLGDIAGGQALLARIAAAPGAAEGTRRSVALYERSLALTGGDEAAAAGLSPSDRIRVLALAAANLATRDSLRAGRLLTQARAEVESAAPSDGDPALRALAVAGNNIAAALEEASWPDGQAGEMRALMLQAAETGLRFWRRAGTWLEEERAHHRLGSCCLRAGQAAPARQQAEACLAIVLAHDSPALEAFFGWELAARAAAAAGDVPACEAARDEARRAFDRLGEDDRGGCQATLDALHRLAPETLPRS